jgi:hypothetical protein
MATMCLVIGIMIMIASQKLWMQTVSCIDRFTHLYCCNDPIDRITNLLFAILFAVISYEFIVRAWVEYSIQDDEEIISRHVIVIMVLLYALGYLKAIWNAPPVEEAA